MLPMVFKMEANYLVKIETQEFYALRDELSILFSGICKNVFISTISNNIYDIYLWPLWRYIRILMNCHLFFLKEQLVKLLKIHSAPPSSINAKKYVLNTYFRVTYINILRQPQSASSFRFPSYSVVNLHGKVNPT